jgi:hypothetical protein
MLAAIDSALLVAVTGGATPEELDQIALADNVIAGAVAHRCGELAKQAKSLPATAADIVRGRADACWRDLRKSYEQ